jgi:GT2 family glycosyltransferase
MSKISVIIPSYNYGRYLPDCVRSVLRQEGVDLGILIIDDASTDDSAEVARAIAAWDSRIEVICHATNKGHIATYNEGIRWLNGDYNVLISADDLLAPGSLARAAAVLDADPDVHLVYGRAARFTDGQLIPEARMSAEWRVEVENGWDWIRARCRDGWNPMWCPEVLVRTSVQASVGGYKPELPHSGDLEMWMRFAAHGGVARIVGADQAYYRIHPGGMHLRSVEFLARLRERRLAFDLFLEEYGDRAPDRERLQELANRRTARDALWRTCQVVDRGQRPGAPLEEVFEFAADAYPSSTRLREYWSLRLRQRAPRLCMLARPVLDAVCLRPVRAWMRWQYRTKWHFRTRGQHRAGRVIEPGGLRVG